MTADARTPDPQVAPALDLLTPQEVAALLKVPLSWVYDAAEDGRLPKIKLGRHLRFRADTLAAMIERLAS